MSNKCDNHTALNKTFNESDGVGQLVSRFHCIINFGTQIVSLKKSQSAYNIGNFPLYLKFKTLTINISYRNVLFKAIVLCQRV